MPAGAYVKLGFGSMFLAASLAPSARRMLYNPGRATLSQVLPPATHAQWLMLKAKYIGADNKAESLRPMFAADTLYSKAVVIRGMTMGTTWPAVAAMAKRHRIKVTDARLKLLPAIERKSVKAGIKQNTATLPGELDCFTRTLYDTIVASVDGGLVHTSSGLEVMTVALATLDSVAIDTLIAPGGCEGDEFCAPDALAAWIARRADSVRRLCPVCTGAFPLAAAGQLEGRRAATHWDWVGRLHDRHPGINVDADKIYVQEGKLWTSAGVTAGIDLTLALIEADYGHQVAVETARQLVLFIKRSSGQSQFSVSLAARLGRTPAKAVEAIRRCERSKWATVALTLAISHA